jgi:hypothetical protein
VRAEGSAEEESAEEEESGRVGLVGEEPLVDSALLQMIKSKCVMKVDAKRKLLLNFSKRNPSDLFSHAFSVREDVACFPLRLLQGVIKSR